MGISVNTLKGILSRADLDYTSIAMLGRQQLDQKENFKKYLRNFSAEELDYIFKESDTPYAENLFHLLGAKEVSSFDVSDYEGATYLQDLNLPLEEQYKNRYSLVLDGGTLEHIFNVAQALQNMIEMVKNVGGGGVIVHSLPYYNWQEHGLYQFSAELFKGLYTEQNGFELLDLCVYANRPKGFVYNVNNPALKFEHFRNKNHCLLMVVAKRIGEIPEKITFQQPKYTKIWQSDKTSNISLNKLKKIYHLLPQSLQGVAKRTFFRQQFYQHRSKW